MNAPFDLPDGIAWRELTDEDRRWLAATTRREPEKCAAINVTITLRHPDGRERQYVDDWFPFEPEGRADLVDGITYQWTEGNFGCDCNRRLFFARAGGESDPDRDASCGHMFRVLAPAWLAHADEGDQGLGPLPYEITTSEQCSQCGAVVAGHHACDGVPGGFSNEP